jgi:hypothetical protein
MTSIAETTTRIPAPLHVARDAFFRFLAVDQPTVRGNRAGAGADEARFAARTEQLWDELGDFA